MTWSSSSGTRTLHRPAPEEAVYRLAPPKTEHVAVNSPENDRVMRSLFLRIGTVAAVLGFSTPLRAQDVPNLTGTWVLDISLSDFGMMLVPLSRTDVIEHQEPSLTLRQEIVSSNGVRIFNLLYRIDGKPHKNKAGLDDLSSMLRWDGEVLVVSSTVETPQGQIVITDRYHLSPDRTALTQIRVFTIGKRETTQRLVFARQQG